MSSVVSSCGGGEGWARSSGCEGEREMERRSRTSGDRNRLPGLRTSRILLLPEAVWRFSRLPGGLRLFPCGTGDREALPCSSLCGVPTGGGGVYFFFRAYNTGHRQRSADKNKCCSVVKANKYSGGSGRVGVKSQRGKKIALQAQKACTAVFCGHFDLASKMIERPNWSARTGSRLCDKCES